MTFQTKIVHQYLIFQFSSLTENSGGQARGFPLPASHSCCAAEAGREGDFLFIVLISDLNTLINQPRSQTDRASRELNY